MIILNNEKILKELDNNITFVISDFDRTITSFESSTSWSIFNNSCLVDNGFKEESKSLYDYYRIKELDTSISLSDKRRYMADWTDEQVKLFSKYNINKNKFYEIIDESNGLVLRKDFVDFARRLNKLNIKLYIVSGGIYDSIQYTLKKNNVLLNNIIIVSNKLKFNKKSIVGIDGNIITSCNKDSIYLPINSQQRGLLFGDMPEDKDSGCRYNTVDVVFSHCNDTSFYNKLFDITLTDNSSFSNVGNLLIKGYKKIKVR